MTTHRLNQVSLFPHSVPEANAGRTRTKRRLAGMCGAIALTLSASNAMACSCAKPQAPDIPADKFVSALQNGELNDKQSAVKNYILEVADYQQCLVDCIKGVNYELTDISVEAERVVADWKRVVELRDPK